MDIGSIITAVFLVFIALAALIGYGKGKKYVWQYTLTRLVINVLAVMIAIPLTRYISKTIVEAVFTTVLAGELDSSGSIMNNLTVALDVAKTLAAMMIGLFLFFFVRLVVKFILKFFKYAIFRLIVSISEFVSTKMFKKKDKKAENAEATEDAEVSEIDVDENGDTVNTAEFEAESENEEPVVVESVVAPTKTKKPKKKEGCYALKPQLASILIGIFGCIFGVVVVFAPFTGLIGLADDALNVVTTAMSDEIADDEDMANALDIATGITGNFSVKFSNAYGGKIIFNRLTTYKVNDTKIKLKNEVNLVTTIAGSAMTITNEDSSKNDKIDAVEDIMDAFDKSSIIPLILADLVNQAAEAIENDEEFMGIINADNDEGNGDDYYGDGYGNPENDDDDDMGDAMSEKLISELVSSFKGCTPESIKADIRTVGNIIVIFIDHDAITLITENPEDILSARGLITDLLTAFFDNDRLSSLVSTFVELGIEILETQLGMTETLEESYAKMKAELVAIDFYNTTSTDNVKNVANIFYNYGIDITDEGAEAVTMALYQGYNTYFGINLDNVLSSVAVNGKNAPVNLSTLEGFEAESLLITKKEIVITHKDSVSNPKNEAQCIADALFAITDLTNSMSDGDEMEISAILGTVGKILDSLANTEIVGKDVVDKLLLVMFQSEELGANLPMNTVQITNFVNSLIASSGKNGYTAVMSGIGDMVDALSKLSDAEDIDSVEALTGVLETITPETAEALKYFATTDFVGELGVEGESAEGVANVLGTLFDELATAKDADGLNLSDEEYKAEASKISNLLDVTMSISDGSSDGSDISFGDFVDSVMDSKILTNTVINSVCDENGVVTNKDPLNTGMELDEEDEQELIDSLQEKLDANPSEANEQLVVAIAAYMNVDVYVDGNGTIKPLN